MSTIYPQSDGRPSRRWAWWLLGAGVLGLGLFLGALLFGGGHGEAMSAVHDHDAMTAAGDAGQAQAQIWTCSMHPQIQRDEPGACPICGMDLIPLSQNLSDDPTILTMSEAAVAMARVQTTEVGTTLNTPTGGYSTGNDAAGKSSTGVLGSMGAGGQTLSLSGRLATDERLAAVQTAHVPGRIEKLYVGFEGEQVRAGQRLAEVYSPELVNAQRELVEAIRFREVNPALVDAARTKLRNLRIPAATIAEIEAKGAVQTNFTIYADVSGVVLDKRVQLGDYVMQGETLLTLTRLDQLWVLLDAYENDLAGIRVGNRLKFTTPALPGREFEAKVSFIDPLIDAKTRTATIRAEVSNRQGLLKPEMFVRAELQASRTTADNGAGSRANSGIGGASRGAPLLVPKTAVLWTGRRSVVYVEIPDAAVPSYAFREVTLGGRRGEGYEVTSGLSAGERVVTNGAFSIDASAQLNNQFSMMNRDVVVQGSKPGAVSFAALPDYTRETPAAFKQQLGVLAKAYLPLKDAMIAGDAAKGKTAVKGFGESLQTVDMALLKGEAHGYWMEQLKAIKQHSTDLAAAPGIDEQRVQFAFLSQALINTLTAFGSTGATLYVDHCPMALDGAGANWVSADLPIKNPFYGDAMLTCGSVVDTLSPL